LLDWLALAVDKGSRATLAADLAAEDELAILQENTYIGQARDLALVIEFKKALHRTRASPFAHQLGVDGAAEDGVEGTDEDGLAGPGLAGDDVEAGAKFDHRFFDEGKVLDVEASQHRAEAEGLLLVVSLVQKGEAELALGVGGEDLDALAGLVEPLAADARGGDAFFKYFEGLFELEVACFKPLDALFEHG
jgi:hypothetical protein